MLQDVDSNYSIDLFNPFWSRLTELSGHTYSGKFPKTNSVDAVAEAADEGLRKDIAFRVIADHIRCLTFALTDGAVPSNEGRGYVLRRILRRAVRFGRQQLELREPFLHTLVPIVVDAMGEAFPELAKEPGKVAEIIKDEEVSFSKTLDRGIWLFNHSVEVEVMKTVERKFPGYLRDASATPESGYRSKIRLANPDQSRFWTIEVVNGQLTGVEDLDLGPITIPADAAFQLHDTYGFPIDLTRIMAEERGMTVDIAGYEKLMEEAREKARAGGKGEASTLTTLPPSALEQLRQSNISPTDDSEKYGYEQLRAKIVAIWNGSELVDSIKGYSPAAIVLDRTNFYAEMGGQIGDSGTIVTAGGGAFDVETTRAVGGYILHIGKVRDGEIVVGKAAGVTVGLPRAATEKNHTSTHLANWALRETLGDGVQQKGSLVDPEKLRFDFSHGKALAEEELTKIEQLVSQCIEKNLPVYAKEVPQEQALKINGLRAVFGEKYPPLVRVVSVGAPVDELIADPTNPKWREFSVEFCGGTHLKDSSEAQAFAIIGEESVSKGIRRLVALTGDPAVEANRIASELDATIDQIEQLKDGQLLPSIATLQKAVTLPNLPLRAKRRAQNEIIELQRRQKAFEKSNASANSGTAIDANAVATELLNTVTDIAGGKLVVSHVAGASDDVLRGVIDSIKKRSPSYAVLLASVVSEKISFIAVVSDDLIAKGLKAGDWVREAAKVAGGGGGGRPNMAQAGGKDPAKMDEALEVAKQFAMKMLGAG